MIDQPSPNDRDGFEASMRMARKTGHGVAVVHAPAVLSGEVLTDVAAGQRRRRPHRVVACRVSVVVVDAEQERVGRLPLKTERANLLDGRAHAISREGEANAAMLLHPPWEPWRDRPRYPVSHRRSAQSCER